jgi:hypothetical protein
MTDHPPHDHLHDPLDSHDEADTPSKPMNPQTIGRHRSQASKLFNRAWALLDTPNRTPVQDLEMIHAAHASAYFWLLAGTPTNHARSHWQLARIYAALKRPEPANFHAEQCLKLCSDRALTPFDSACAFEVHARAMVADGRFLEARITLARAQLVGATIMDPEERALLQQDIAETSATIPR